MIERVLLDTGPLVALLHKRDSHHKRCVASIRSMRADLITCWPVITEAAWLLKSRPRELHEMMSRVGRGAYVLADLQRDAAWWIGDFLIRYAEQKAQLADAALMYLAEREGIRKVLTLDLRDFSIYRTTKGLALDLILL